MRSLQVTALGAFTPVGTNIPQTMGSLLAKLQWFDDLDLLGATGDPVSGARTPLRSIEDMGERFIAMSQFALSECRRNSYDNRSQRGQAPLFLATSESRDLPCPPDFLLDAIIGRANGDDGDEIVRRDSRVFAAGRLGAIRALAAGQNAIRSGEFRSCYVGGVDSLLDPVRLHELLDQGRLMEGAGSDGFIPGEGAAFLKFELGKPSSTGVPILGSSVAEDRADTSVARSLMARVAGEALREGHLDASSITALVHDVAGEQVRVEEIAMALTRMKFDHPAQLPAGIWSPGFSVGETGAAAAFICLAMTAFFVRERVFEGPVLAWFTSETSARAAFVMGTNSLEDHRG